MRENEIITENLRKWFKEKWVRFGPDGKIRGACARGDDSEGKPKCLPQAKAHALGKKGRKYAASKKRREDPNPERSGKAINVATKKKTNENDNFKKEFKRQELEYELRNEPPNNIQVAINGKPWKVFPGKGRPDSQEEFNHLRKMQQWAANKSAATGKKWTVYLTGASPTLESVAEEKCPECGGPMYHESMMNEKKDACYHKVRSRYKVWPSAYASGALVQCRKKGASNWGKKSESVEEGTDQEFHTGGSKGLPMPGTYEQENDKFMRHGQRRIMAMTNEEEINEKWSEKYKRSIDCSNPKGFSQRAHCQGRKK